MINDKSQDSTAKHLRLDEQLPLKCIIQCAGKRIFKIGEHLAKLQAKMLDRVIRPICFRLLSSKMQNSQISKVTCLLRTETVTDCFMLIGKLM